jgi:beta-lactamase regulating signal transducer with metallopeptidase domain
MAFVVGLLAVPITFSWLRYSDPAAVVVRSASVTTLLDEVRIGASPARSAGSTWNPGPSQPASEVALVTKPAAGDAVWIANRRDAWLLAAPWLAGLYVAGVMMMLVRLTRGMIHTERLRTGAQPIAAGPLVKLLHHLSRNWSLRVVPMLAEGERIVVPKVIGLLRPTILLPASALSGLSTGELEMILAHELAHIRRHDMWVNLLQKLAEVALFFNPAMWYLSRRIATLREYCCDELVCRSMARPGSEPRLRYATALLRIVELAQASSAPQETIAALAASGRSPSELRRRVARLFGEPLAEPVQISRGGILTLAATGLLIACSTAIWPVTAQTTDPTATPEQAYESAIKIAAKEFSFGATIEVLAIGTHDETPQRWWNDGGEVLDSVPFTWSKVSSVTSPDKRWRRIIFRVDQLPEDAGVQWHLEGARASGGGAVTIDGERNPGGYFTRYFAVADDLKAFDLRIGIATGPWNTVVTIGGSGTQATGGTGAKSLVSSGPVEIEGGTAVFLSHNYNDQDYRVIAIDKQGESHNSTLSGGASAGEISQTRPTFPRLKPRDIDHFEFQVRDYEWIEFQRLPLNPGDAHLQDASETEPTVKLDQSPEAVAKRTNWLQTLLGLSKHNQTAFMVGPQMISDLSADDGFEVVRQAWPKLQADEVKTGLLKTFEFARNPRVLDVLDLGARDKSQMVR